MFCIFVSTRKLHFTTYSKCANLSFLCFCRNKHHILVLQCNIRLFAIHYCLQVNSNNSLCTIILQSMNNNMFWVCVFCKSLCSNNQLANSVYPILAQLIHSWTKDSALHLNHVLISVEHRINAQHITIHKFGSVHNIFANSIYLTSCTVISLQAQLLFIGIVCKPTSIIKNSCHIISFAHFISHWSFHSTSYLYKTIERTNNNHIIILQTYISCQSTIHDILVNINHTHLSAVAINLNVTECSKIIYTTCHIQCMKNSSKSTQSVCSRYLNFTHHIHMNATCRANRSLHTTASISLSQSALQFSISPSNSQTT